MGSPLYTGRIPSFLYSIRSISTGWMRVDCVGIVGKSKGYIYLLCHYFFSCEKPTSILMLLVFLRFLFVCVVVCVCVWVGGGCSFDILPLHFIYVDYV